MVEMADLTHQFSDDAPKADPWHHDALGFAGFAHRVAKALVEQRAPSGYVLGLHGEWGSGKSTVLNFVRAYLERWRDEEQDDLSNLQWLAFDPWIVSGHQDLAAAYFKVLSEKIGDAADKRAAIRRMAKGAIDAGADKIADAAASVGWIIDHTGGAASKAGAAVGKVALKKAAEKWLSEPSLQKTYRQLVERLMVADRRFIVFIDDIDRLTNEEIRSLMQMVKTVGRLPNVTYLLSYDRQIVWSALGSFAPSDGARSGYAEKIVQHEIEVPVPSRSGLMRMLERGLPDLPSPTPTGVRWMEIMQAGLQRWLRHPRDVVRLCNAMHFAWAALKDEIDPYDVLCMEALRLFDRTIFDWVRDNREALLGEGLSYGLVTDEKAASAAADVLGDTLSAGAKANIVPILRILFPNRVKMFGGRRGYSTETWSSVVARRGIASPAGYTAYFSLSPSPFAVPKAWLDEASRPETTRERHAGLIDQALALRDEAGASQAGEYLQELNHRLSAFGPIALVALLEALTDRTVAVMRANDDAGVFGPASAHHVLIGDALERLGPERSSAALEAIFTTSDDVGALAALFMDLARSIGVIPSEGSTRRHYIPAEMLSRLGTLLLPKIVAAHVADELSALPAYYDVARTWIHLGGGMEARAWLADEARRNGHTLATLSRGLLGTSTDENGMRFGVYRDPDTDFYDIDAIEEGCIRFGDEADLNDSERARIKALHEGIGLLRRKASLDAASDGRSE